MREYKVEDIRNVGFISHGSAGKTSLAEAVLFTAGQINRLGRVEEGTTVSDYNADEIERKISIMASLLYCDWRNKKINLIDTPGYMDFLGEVKGALRVVDAAVVLLNALSGVEVGTEQVWGFAEEEGIPRLFFVNQLDKEHADFDKAMQMAKERFGDQVLPIQLPLNQGPNFNSVVDLLKMKVLKFQRDKTGKYTLEDIPDDIKSKAEEYREKLIEAAAESDDELLELYLDKGELSEEEIKRGLRKGIIERNIFPLLCGSAVNNIGVSPLLDLIVDFFPSPADVPSVKGFKPKTNEEEERKPDVTQPLSALVFKTISEPHVGEFSLLRVYSGVLSSGDDVLNSNRGISERIGQLYLLNGKMRREIGYINAGDIGAVVKLKDTHTGDTLCDKRNPILLRGIEFPPPVIRVAIEPKSKGDEEKISNGLASLHEEDPSFVVDVDSELRQTVISGQGELHLNILVKRLKNKFGVDVNVVEPKIPYRETLRGVAEVQGKYKKQTGGRGQYGDVWLKIEPLPRGAGFQFVDAIVGGVVPSKYIPAVEKGVVEAMKEGVIAGYPVVDVKVTLYDGSYHPVDSSDIAFKIAGSMAFKKGFKQADPLLLEPIYDVEVFVPEEYMGDVMGDLSSRRGKILGIEDQGPFKLIKAKVPLAELYKYSTTLRSLTAGKGMHRRKFSHYEEVPREISEKIIAHQEKKR